MRYLLLVFCALAVTAYTDVHHVPGDYSGIQLAIDAATAGDLILVSPGTYLENLDFLGKAVVVKSRHGPESTVIDGGGAGGVVLFDKGESPDTILEGFTITNGYSFKGGGIFCSGSFPKIIGNIITNNRTEGALSRGAGICCYHAGALIMDNTIVDNLNKGGLGGGIFASGSTGPVVMNNLVADNSSCGYASEDTSTVFVMRNIFLDNYASGIYVYRNMLGEISNNILVGNDYGLAIGEGSVHAMNNTITRNGVGLYFDAVHNVLITNTIVWGNWGDPVYLAAGGPPPIGYSDIEGGWPGTGNINADPLFVDLEARDFHIRYDSPCREAANPLLNSSLEIDFEGDPRPVYSVADMGADEFHTHLYFIGQAVPGETIEIKLTDTPGKTPSLLWVGTGALDPPLPTNHGNWHLELPILLELALGVIPAPGGVIAFPVSLPASMPAWDIPLQAFIQDKLTNLCVIPVK